MIVAIVAAACTAGVPGVAALAPVADEEATLAGVLELARVSTLGPVYHAPAIGSLLHAVDGEGPAAADAARDAYANARANVPFLLLPDGGVILTLLPDGATMTSLASSFALPRAWAPTEPAPARARLLGAAPPLTLQDLPATEDASPVEPIAPAAPESSSTRASAASAKIAPAPTTPFTTAVVAGASAAGLLALLGLALYHRIRPHSALENDTRKAIFDAVCGNPGMGVQTIAHVAGVSYSTATYHLERLTDAGMIVMTPDGNKLCYYKNGGAFTEAERRILPLLKNEEAAKLFEAILDSPGTYRAALAERLGVTATTINWHLKRLREAGLVHETRQGRNAYLYANVPALHGAVGGLAAKLDGTDTAIAERLRKYTAVSS